MALRRASPHRHPKTGVYWFRKRVSKDLLPLVGKKEEWRSLDTKDPVVAKARHTMIHAEVEEIWARLRRGQVGLTHEQIHGLAGEVYRAIVAEHAADPGGEAQWRKALAFDDFVRNARERLGKRPDGLRLATGWSHAEAMLRDRYAPQVDDLLARHGLQVGAADRRCIVLAAADAARDAHERLRRNAAGDYTPDPKADRFPPLAMPKDPLTIDALWAAYKKSKKPSPGTVKRWDPVITKMREFTKCTDVHALTENDLLRWRDHLLETGGIQPKTVKETYIAAVRAVLGWGKTERKLKANDAADVNVTLPNSDKQKVRSKGFTDEEASTILSATLAPFSDLMTPEHAAARRWVPWICAYTGARVNEITQLRAEDVIRCVFPSGVPGYAAGTAFWALNITPEAGTVKTGTYRVVPLHDHLIEQGFVAFAMAKGQGPLFYAPERQKKGASGQNPTYARVGQALGEWVRGLGVDDPNVAPNHGWRHRFKTIGRQVGMDSAKLDAIQGHVQSNEGGEYGEFPAAALKPEIDKMPSYDVTAALTVDRRTRGAARAARR